MAVPLHLTSASCFQSKNGVVSAQASLNCATKVFVGLKSQSTSLYKSTKPNNNAEFFEKVSNSLNIRSRNKPSGGRVTMMPIGTPLVPYKTPGEGTYQWVDLYNAFYRERIIFIGQEIDEEFSNQILATMLYLDSLASDQKIFLYINCQGGDLTPSLALYDTMQSLQTPVGTFCLSYANDMASFILAAGHKGNRVAMPLSTIDLRSPAGSSRGRADDVLNEAAELVKAKEYLYNELAKNTGQPVEKIHEDLKKVRHFRVEQAIDYGLIDRAVIPEEIAGEAPPKARSDIIQL